jgi:hypothetical protein
MFSEQAVEYHSLLVTPSTQRASSFLYAWVYQMLSSRQVFTIKVLCTFRINGMRATCPVHLILLALITLIIKIKLIVQIFSLAHRSTHTIY